MDVKKEDPRLTAFALGELDDDARDAFEKAVAADPELQELVKEVGVAANLAGLALRQANAPGLSDEQRQAVLKAGVTAEKASRARGRSPRLRRFAKLVAMAACIVLGLGAYGMWLMVGEPLGESIQTTKRMEGEIVFFAPAQPADAPAESELTEELHALGYSDNSGWASTHKRPTDQDAQAPAGQPTVSSRGNRGSSLQNVQVGGEIRVRENYYVDSLEGEPTRLSEENRPELVAGVPEATSEPEGAPGFVEQRTRLNVKGDFADRNLQLLPILEEEAVTIDALPDDATSSPTMEAQEGEPRILAYDVDGDEALGSIPFYTRPDGNKVHDLVALHDTSAANQFSTPGFGGGGGGGFGGGGGGGFGGGGFGGGGQTNNLYGQTLETGSPSPTSGELPGLNQNGARGSGENINYNRFVGEGTKLSRNYSDPNTDRFIDLDSYDVWGEDFRSNYITGHDKRAGTRQEVRIYQAYIDTDEKFGRYSVRRLPGTESYAPIPVKPFTQVSQEPLSTFSVDVDTASYANVRRFLTQGQLPPPDAVRVEEMINYFDYEYAPPRGEDPISVDVEIAQCVWETQHRLARIALKAREVAMDDRGPANLVFLIDVSGSMKDANKLPLLKESMKALTRQLQPQDRVAIVTYRDAASIALSPTTVGDRITVETAINGLHADGSTNGAGGLELAYSVASQNVIKGSINRVILATDGDFNVGETDNDRLVELIRNSAATGVFLTVLGFGEGNLKDDRLEAMADKGNGAYHYIDNYNEATRVLCAQVGATLATVAKDVKIQVEFNPQHVSAYRLIGYENRALAAADFNNDRKDAGEMGSGEAVTALYEIVPTNLPSKNSGLDEALRRMRGSEEVSEVDSLKYQTVPTPPPAILNPSAETMTVKVRYKDPEGDASRKFEVPVVDHGQGYDQSSRDYRWAVAVAGFGSLLRHPPMQHATWSNNDGTEIFTAAFPGGLGTLTLAQVREIAEGANGYDPDGRRAEFLSLVVAAQTLTGQ